jgi:hypothetical protein
VQVSLPLPLPVMSGNEGVSAAVAMEKAASRNVRMMIDSRVESMAAIGEVILECRGTLTCASGSCSKQILRREGLGDILEGLIGEVGLTSSLATNTAVNHSTKASS